MKKLFLDDKRDPWDNTWDVVRTPQEFRDYITSNKKLPYIISFDHDLHEEHYVGEMYKDTNTYNRIYKKFKHETGLDLAQWLCQYCVDSGLGLPKINIHSANPIGAENIANTFMNYSLFYYEEEILIIPKSFDQEPIV